MKLILAFLSLCLLTTPGVASIGEGGVATGGGGAGVEVDGQVFLVDLFQVNRHNNPFYTPLKAEDQEAFLRLNFKLSTLPGLASLSGTPDLSSIFHLVAYEIFTLKSIDAVLGNSTFEAVKNLTWNLVDSDFVPTEDMSDTFLNKEIIPIAVRVGQNVYINSKTWAKMDLHNKAALIIHEALSAFANPRYTQGRVRQFVGDLYTPEFYKRGHDFMTKRIVGLPTYSMARQIIETTFLKIDDRTGTSADDDGFFAPVGLDELIFKPVLKLRVIKNGQKSTRFYDMISKTEFEPCQFLAPQERLLDFALLAFKVTLDPRAQDESPNFDWRPSQHKIMGLTNTKIKTVACSYNRVGVLDWYKSWMK